MIVDTELPIIDEEQQAANDADAAETAKAILQDVTDKGLDIINPYNVLQQPGMSEILAHEQDGFGNYKWTSGPLIKTPLFSVVQIVDVHCVTVDGVETHNFESHLIIEFSFNEDDKMHTR